MQQLESPYMWPVIIMLFIAGIIVLSAFIYGIAYLVGSGYFTGKASAVRRALRSGKHTDLF